LFKNKYRSDGSVERNKEKLVIQGCRQIKDIDYEETFAFAAKMTTVRALLAVTAQENWYTCQMVTYMKRCTCLYLKIIQVRGSLFLQLLWLKLLLNT